MSEKTTFEKTLEKVVQIKNIPNSEFVGNKFRFGDYVQKDISMWGHLPPEIDDEKEFVATRRKMTTDGGEDITDDEGNQLYDLFISREEVGEQSEESKQISEEHTETEPSQNGHNNEKEQKDAVAEEDFEGMWD